MFLFTRKTSFKITPNDRRLQTNVVYIHMQKHTFYVVPEFRRNRIEVAFEHLMAWGRDENNDRYFRYRLDLRDVVIGSTKSYCAYCKNEDVQEMIAWLEAGVTPPEIKPPWFKSMKCRGDDV